MCGIYACVLWSPTLSLPNQFHGEEVDGDNLSLVAQIENHSSLRRRGPDAFGSDHMHLEGVSLHLSASVLSLRGDTVTSQPFIGEQSKNRFMWNGELYDEYLVPSHMNDGEAVFELLQNAESENDIVSILHNLRGPYAFAYFDARSRILWFGRDQIGRRSLLFRFNEGPEKCMQISSVVDEQRQGKGWVELPCSGIFSLQLNSFHPWQGNSVLISFDQVEDIVGSQLAESTSETLNKTSFKLSPLPCPASKLLALLSRAVEDRVVSVDLPSSHSQARFGLLFSGGIDCTILAALLDRHVPREEPIDLLNVSFGVDRLSAPDRLTAINSLIELQSLSSREWRLIEIDLTLDDVKLSNERVRQLIYPCSTVMDFNIGTVLWHGARGRGRHYQASYTPISSPLCRYAAESSSLEHQNPGSNASFDHCASRFSAIETSCKILFMGIGADELFGGYGRHRTALRLRGESGLREELDRDLNRIWKRNLGRDDRLISDWGREARHPFLDENVIALAQSLESHHLCSLEHPPGLGDKIVLRQVAQLLELPKVSSLVKRAIQFGTRVANKKVSGQIEMDSGIRVDEIVNPIAAGLCAGTRPQVSSRLCKKVFKSQSNERKAPC